jgi:hypothetical protein
MIRLLLVFGCFWLALAFASGAFGKRGPLRAGLFHPLEGRGGTRWVDHAIGLALACFFAAICLKGASILGFTRDEGM